MPKKEFIPFTLEKNKKNALPTPESKDPHTLGDDIPIDQYEAEELLKKIKEDEELSQKIEQLTSRISELESLLSEKDTSLAEALSQVEDIKNCVKNDMLQYLKSIADSIVSSAISDRLPIVIEKMIMEKLQYEEGAKFYASEATSSRLNLSLIHQDCDLPDGVVVCVSKAGQRSVVEIDQ